MLYLLKSPRKTLYVSLVQLCFRIVPIHHKRDTGVEKENTSMGHGSILLLFPTLFNKLLQEIFDRVALAKQKRDYILFSFFLLKRGVKGNQSLILLGTSFCSEIVCEQLLLLGLECSALVKCAIVVGKNVYYYYFGSVLPPAHEPESFIVPQ